MGTPIIDDFVEHSHPQYRRGYFCTEDVLAKLAALEADARRYRWLATNRWYVQVMSDVMDRYPKFCVIGTELDKAIDAALSQEPGGK